MEGALQFQKAKELKKRVLNFYAKYEENVAIHLIRSIKHFFFSSSVFPSLLSPEKIKLQRFNPFQLRYFLINSSFTDFFLFAFPTPESDCVVILLGTTLFSFLFFLFEEVGGRGEGEGIRKNILIN